LYISDTLNLSVIIK